MPEAIRLLLSNLFSIRSPCTPHVLWFWKLFIPNRRQGTGQSLRELIWHWHSKKIFYINNYILTWTQQLLWNFKDIKIQFSLNI